MNLSSDDSTGRHRVTTALAILALILVAAGIFTLMYLLARGGTFDALLRGTPTTQVVVLTRTATPPAVPASTSTPTLQLVATATLRPLTATAVATASPGLTAVIMPTFRPTATVSPTASPTAVAEAAVERYRIEYLGCDPRGSDIGIVKGQVFDRNGKVIAGAEVRVSLDGWAYDQPAISNDQGWYEFYLQKGLKVKITSLRMDGQDVVLVGNAEAEFLAQGGCFEYVNLRQE
jgi:hypothetical protein